MTDQPTPMTELVGYQEGAVVSRTLHKNEGGSVTLFAFDAGQGLSEHTTPYEALVHVVDGRASVRVGNATHDVRSGEVIRLPADVPHALEAPARFKMVLTMLRDRS